MYLIINLGDNFMKFYKNVYAEINLDNLVHNLELIRSVNGNQKIIAVVKDDAYGHGAVEISKKLIENNIEMLDRKSVV